jgi:competence protein ComEC
MLLLCVTVGIWSAVYAHSFPGKLTVVFLDVGQGDAVLIESPTGLQVLIDGGPDRKVLRELASNISWLDRSIDVVVATHPDGDHITGLIDVLERYEVAHIVHPGVVHDTPVAAFFTQAVEDEGAIETVARRGQRLVIGGGAYIDIIFPDRVVANIDTNDASVITRLVYGDTSFLLTGDASQKIEEYVVGLDGAQLQSTVLKAGHHGSKTSTSPLFVGYVAPEYAVISRGCDNSYGHPHADVLATLAEFEVIVYDTCDDGPVTFVSDGLGVQLR